MEVRLDGAKMSDKEAAHIYLREMLSFPPYYGKNLDALWDMLVTYDGEICIVLENKDAVLDHLENYGKALIEVFEDAVRAKVGMTFVVAENREEMQV